MFPWYACLVWNSVSYQSQVQMRCREGILLEWVEGLQAKLVTKVVTKVFPKAFLKLVLEVLSPKMVPKCTTMALLLLGHQPACFVIHIWYMWHILIYLWCNAHVILMQRQSYPPCWYMWYIKYNTNVMVMLCYPPWYNTNVMVMRYYPPADIYDTVLMWW